MLATASNFHLLCQRVNLNAANQKNAGNVCVHHIMCLGAIKRTVRCIIGITHIITQAINDQEAGPCVTPKFTIRSIASRREF